MPENLDPGAPLEPPARIPLLLRPALWLARRMTGKDPLPARLLAHFPKAALAGGLLEVLSAHAPGDLDARTLKLARLTASVVVGCPFCIDMNAHEHEAAGVSRAELAHLVRRDLDGLLAALASPRDRVVVELARAMSATPVAVDAELRARLGAELAPRAIVAVSTAIAQVNYWARLNPSLGVPAAGFFFAEGSRCDALPETSSSIPSERRSTA